MSVDIQHINGDATFLLTFTSKTGSDGTFTVLLDPWLDGESTIFHPKFALAKRTLTPCIHHLSEIPPPDVVVISQDRTDHCHEPTLKQLDADLPNTVILAAPAAAKRIRSWKYFNPDKVHAFPQFSDKKGNTIVRFLVPSTIPGSMPGEATLAFIGAKFDIAGVHNAIGVTYRPPASAPLVASPLPSPAFPGLRSRASAFELYQEGHAYHNFPPTPPESPPTSANTSRKSSRQRHASNPDSSLLAPPESPHTTYNARHTITSPPNHRHTRSNSSQNFSRPFSQRKLSRSESETSESEEAAYDYPPQSSADSPPVSPTWTNVSMQSYTAFRPKTLSVIYSPHGLSYQAIRPYATSHLIQNAALPLTCLLHSFDRISNPWYLGGNVNAGSPGGLEIARSLLAKCWISAHDEDKENSGIAVLKAVTKKYTAQEVAALLEHDLHEGNGGKKGGTGKVKGKGKGKVNTDVRVLGVGEHMILP